MYERGRPDAFAALFDEDADTNCGGAHGDPRRVRRALPSLAMAADAAQPDQLAIRGRPHRCQRQLTVKIGWRDGREVEQRVNVDMGSSGATGGSDRAVVPSAEKSVIEANASRCTHLRNAGLVISCRRACDRMAHRRQRYAAASMPTRLRIARRLRSALDHPMRMAGAPRAQSDRLWRS
jgi:hypothetical protein